MINLDDPLVVAMPQRRRSARSSFSLRAAIGADYAVAARDGELVAHARAASRCCPCRELKIKGLHNAANALAALALGEALGAAAAPRCSRSCASFPGLPHRSQWVADVRGVTLRQ